MADTKTVLDQQNINNAKTAIDNYVATCQSIFQNMKVDIEAMTAAGADFNGDAANGYLYFFEKIIPSLTTNLYGSDDALMDGMKKILDSIAEALLNQMDVGLGNANKNAAPDTAAPAASE